MEIEPKPPTAEMAEMEGGVSNADSRPARASRGPGILIIEGDSLMRSLIQEWLAGAGYAVCDDASRHGSGARVDLVIVDLYMPRNAGARIIRAVQRAHPGIPVIAISGQFRPGLAATSPAARTLGVTRVLAKPFSRDDLISTVRAVVGPPK